MSRQPFGAKKGCQTGLSKQPRNKKGCQSWQPMLPKRCRNKKITTFLATFLSTYVDRDGCHFNAPWPFNWFSKVKWIFWPLTHVPASSVFTDLPYPSVTVSISMHILLLTVVHVPVMSLSRQDFIFKDGDKHHVIWVPARFSLWSAFCSQGVSCPNFSFRVKTRAQNPCTNTSSTKPVQLLLKKAKRHLLIPSSALRAPHAWFVSNNFPKAHRQYHVMRVITGHAQVKHAEAFTVQTLTAVTVTWLRRRLLQLKLKCHNRNNKYSTPSRARSVLSAGQASA